MNEAESKTPGSKQGYESILTHFGIRSQQGAFFFVTLVLAVLIALTILSIRDAWQGTNTVLLQSLGLVFGLIFCFVAGRGYFSQDARKNEDQYQIHPGWLLVLLAIILRVLAYQFLPPPNQTGFEEVEQGANAFQIINNHFLQVEFRFTNILATLGMASGLGYSLETLRLPFKAMGIIGLIFIVLTLRKLKISWVPILILTFITATLRIFVIFSGTAFELFAGIPMVTIFLYLIIRAEDETSQERGIWYGLAGLTAGILMFEFVAYRILPFLFFCWLVFYAIRKSSSAQSEPRDKRWFYLLLFIIPLYLVALPTFAQTVTNPAGSTFLEAYFRHRGERPAIIAPNAIFLLQNLIQGSFGFPSAESALTSIPLDPIVLPVVGWLFSISLVYNLVFPISKFSRPLAISVILTILLGGLFANDFRIGRMGPNFPVMTILAGFMLNELYLKLQNWIRWLATRRQIFTVILPENQPLLLERPHNASGEDSTDQEMNDADASQRVIIDVTRMVHRSIQIIAHLVIISAVLAVVVANFQSIYQMSRDPGSLNEYANDDYFVCSFIGSVAKAGQRVVIVSFDHGGFCSDNPAAGWYFQDKKPIVIHAEDQASAVNSLMPGDLLAFATRNRPFTKEETDQFIKIATDLNSITSIQFGKNLMGKTTISTICYQCNLDQQ